jgi:hypothetical protein
MLVVWGDIQYSGENKDHPRQGIYMAHPALEPGVIHLVLCSLGQLPLWFYKY